MNTPAHGGASPRRYHRWDNGQGLRPQGMAGSLGASHFIS